MRGEPVSNICRGDTDDRATSWSLSEFLNMLDLRGQTWCVVEIRSSGGFSVPPDDGVLFYSVLSGSARVAGVTGGTMELQPGQVRMILSGEAHAIRTAADSPTQTLNFLREEQNVDVPPTFVIGTGPLAARILCARLRVNWPSGLRRTAMPPAVSIGNENSTNAMRVKTLQFFAAGAGAAALLTRIAALLLAIALRNHPQCPLLFRMSASNDPIAHALQMIDADLSSEWSVAKLARKVGMSRSNFAARFTAEVGRTPMEMVMERRMQFAAGLLRRGSLKIIEISARVGYHSEAAFSRRFSRFFGMSPGQMRSVARKERQIEAGELDWQSVVTF